MCPHFQSQSFPLRSQVCFAVSSLGARIGARRLSVVPFVFGALSAGGHCGLLWILSGSFWWVEKSVFRSEVQGGCLHFVVECDASPGGLRLASLGPLLWRQASPFHHRISEGNANLLSSAVPLWLQEKPFGNGSFGNSYWMNCRGTLRAERVSF